MNESKIAYSFTVYGTGVVDIYDKAKLLAGNFFAEWPFYLDIECHLTPEDSNAYKELKENGKYTAHVKAVRCGG